MFTGIVQTKATVIAFDGNDSFRTITLSVANDYLEKLNIGASIAINGVCLTVTKFESHISDVVGQVQFDIIDETLNKTNLRDIQVGEKVNFERSMTFGTELGGHIVSGHIHCTAKIAQIVKLENNYKIQLSLPQKWQKYVLYKGFVSVNGASLTVGNIDEFGFWLHLIPETLDITNLGEAVVGDEFNIEVDQQTYTIINTVENYMRQHS
mgnify:CR=1 FL=1